MLKRYKIKNTPTEVNLIAVEDVKELVKDGFLILQFDTRNPDSVNDMIEALGVSEFPFPVIVCDTDALVYEVIEEAHYQKQTFQAEQVNKALNKLGLFNNIEQRENVVNTIVESLNEEIQDGSEQPKSE